MIVSLSVYTHRRRDRSYRLVQIGNYIICIFRFSSRYSEIVFTYYIGNNYNLYYLNNFARAYIYKKKIK